MIEDGDDLDDLYDDYVLILSSVHNCRALNMYSTVYKEGKVLNFTKELESMLTLELELTVFPFSVLVELLIILVLVLLLVLV